MSVPSHPVHVRLLEAARHAGLEIGIVRFGRPTRTADEAASAVGTDVARIVKSLVFVTVEDVPRPCLALIGGADRVDPGRVAAALGAPAVRRATPDEARTATGAAIGGVPPFGHPASLPTVMDAALERHRTVWAAAGTPDSVFEIAPTDLVRLAAARVAHIAADGGPDARSDVS